MVLDKSWGVICFVGIGSNIGDPPVQISTALRRLSEENGIKILKTSSFYITEPVGIADQPHFINAVVEIRATDTPYELITTLQTIEKSMGRSRYDEKWGPRVIDLDILLYGQDVIQEMNLIIPHPELHKRRFVLVPLCEIAPYVIHPAFGISISGLLSRVDDKSAVDLYKDSHVL
jgi:2-amino-4-hydroxy-6-hydroxymethyldihydropteridine diphosphokinase